MHDKQKALLIGCGHKQEPSFAYKGGAFLPWDLDMEVVRLDCNKDVNPDVLKDLNDIVVRPDMADPDFRAWLPMFENEEFDEIHAYEVMEHVGHQGDWKLFFTQFTDLWRILKPGGHIILSSPKPDGIWAWGDPGHTRVISPQLLSYLNQKHYEQCGKTQCSDYRFYYKANFSNTTYSQPLRGNSYVYYLQKS